MIWPQYHARLVALLGELGLSLAPRPFRHVAFHRCGESRPYAWYDAVDLPLRATNLVLPGAPGLRDTWRVRAMWLQHWATLRGRTGDLRSVGEWADPGDDFGQYFFPWLCGSLGFPRASTVLACPVQAVVAFQSATVGIPPSIVAEGTELLASRLLERAAFRPGHTIDEVVPHAGGVRLRGTTGGRPFEVRADDVVLAVPPAAIVRIATVPADFGRFPLDRITLRVHRDRTFLPPDPADWRRVHYTLPADPEDGVATTIRWEDDLLFTWNDPRHPAEVLAESELLRPLTGVVSGPTAGRSLPGVTWSCSPTCRPRTPPRAMRSRRA